MLPFGAATHSSLLRSGGDPRGPIHGTPSFRRRPRAVLLREKLSPSSASSSARSRMRPCTSTCPSIAGTSRTTTAPGPNPSKIRPSSANSAVRAVICSTSPSVSSTTSGISKPLAPDSGIGKGGLHTFIDQSFVCRVLVDNHDAIFCLGDDIGLMDLCAAAPSG